MRGVTCGLRFGVLIAALAACSKDEVPPVLGGTDAAVLFDSAVRDGALPGDATAGGPDVALPCGGPDQPCCVATLPCGLSLACTAGTCRAVSDGGAPVGDDAAPQEDATAGGPDVALTCGGPDQTCCMATPPCAANYGCTAGFCRALATGGDGGGAPPGDGGGGVPPGGDAALTCGGTGQGCCMATPPCAVSLACIAGSCQPMPPAGDGGL